MRKKLSFALGAGVLTLVMSSCFVLQSFTVLDYTLNKGQTTKGRFTLRPMNVGLAMNEHQFVLVGVSTGGDITAGKAVWGTNARFGGPLVMAANGGLAAAIGSDCSSNGLNFANITGITWKGYITPVPIRDRGLVERKAIVDVNVKATINADSTVNYTVMGVNGVWDDDGNDIVDSNDTFFCGGIATSSVYINS